LENIFKGAALALWQDDDVEKVHLIHFKHKTIKIGFSFL